MSTANVIQLPLKNGNTLNCIVRRPVTSLVSQFRKLSRQILDKTFEYNALIDKLRDAANEDERQAILAQLDASDEASAALITLRARTVLQPHSTTSESADDATTGSLDDVDWGNVESPVLSQAAGFFEKSISA